MLVHGKKPVSDKLADQLQNVLQEYRKEKESGYGTRTEDPADCFRTADDVWNAGETGEMADEYIEENEDSIAFDPVEWITNLKQDGKATAYRKVNMQKRQESIEVITVYC